MLAQSINVVKFDMWEVGEEDFKASYMINVDNANTADLDLEDLVKLRDLLNKVITKESKNNEYI